MVSEKDILTIMISHDINIAAKYSDEIIMMHDGKIFATGTPEEVITEDNLRTVYGVECVVVEDQGSPHVILRDSIPIDSPEGGSTDSAPVNDDIQSDEKMHTIDDSVVSSE
jgi:iron complex transport system ATP-binding protein